MRTHVRLGLGLALATFFGAHVASATNILETGDNGSEQMGRGGAWVARASDPLAAFYNPAGLAGQDTRFTLQANINIQSTCFTRIKDPKDGTQEDGAAGGTTVNPGSSFPQVCNTSPPFPDPQIAFTYRVSPRLGLGIAILGPSAAGQQNWPEQSADGTPSPQRYMLLNGNTLLLTPTFAVGWEPIDRFRIGASFLWGIANLDFTNDSWASNLGGPGASVSSNDIKGELKVKQMFIPGFTLGTIWSPTDDVDIAGWYKYMAPIDAKGDVTTQVGTGRNAKYGDTTLSDCGKPGTTPGTCAPNDVEVKVTIPMEAKLGIRYHKIHPDAVMEHRRDPMSQDIWDIEADLTWANNSAFKDIRITFPSDPATGNPIIPVNGTPGFLPPDASIPHNFKDVIGVRLGGDYNVVPDKLAIRLGGYFESKAQDSQYQNIDFAGQWRTGFALGGTWRIHTGDAPSKRAIELSLGFGHTFIGSSTNNGPNGVPALSGVACNPVGGNTAAAGGLCSDGSRQYRTEWAVNLGTITNSFSQINLGASYRF